MALGHEVKERCIARFDFKAPTAASVSPADHSPIFAAVGGPHFAIAVFLDLDPGCPRFLG
jgi:hypothetical protein